MWRKHEATKMVGTDDPAMAVAKSSGRRRSLPHPIIKEEQAEVAIAFQSRPTVLSGLVMVMMVITPLISKKWFE